MFLPPSHECPLCPRLGDFHRVNRSAFPAWHNGPVPSFGNLDAELLVVGLAPGLRGANATGRPFTGDYAGLILYAGLKKHGFAKGEYKERPDDGFTLVNCRITNAVRCVPPENKPETSEIKACNNFLKQEIAAMQNLKVVLSLGNISHTAVLMALGQKKTAFKFVHGAAHEIPAFAGMTKGGGRESGVGGARSADRPSLEPRSIGVAGASAREHRNIILLNTYHTSRYNMNTRRLTQEMFDAVVEQAKTLL